MRDQEVHCREKDAEIRDLKEKVVKLSSLARQLEIQKADLVHQVKVMVSSLFILMFNLTLSGKASHDMYQLIINSSLFNFFL